MNDDDNDINGDVLASMMVKKAKRHLSFYLLELHREGLRKEFPN